VDRHEQADLGFGRDHRVFSMSDVDRLGFTPARPHCILRQGETNMRTTILLATLVLIGSNVLAQEDSQKDLIQTSPMRYAATNHFSHRLSIRRLVPLKKNGPLPVVAVVHRGGSDAAAYKLLAPFVESGEYAGVSIWSRRLDEGIWPDQIHDCKAAIRWLRANAKRFNLDPDRIGVAGIYGGGHLAAMLGTSGDVETLEGNVGEYPNVSSRVACVVDLFGQTDLLAMGERRQRTPNSMTSSWGSLNTPSTPSACRTTSNSIPVEPCSRTSGHRSHGMAV
jgi:acetyl esterase/lipase